MLTTRMIYEDKWIREKLLERGWIPPGVVECQKCVSWKAESFRPGSNRGNCHNPKVLGYQGDDDDGIYQWEAAEVHCGPRFGCIHFVKKEA